jgi:hypothetical protein
MNQLHSLLAEVEADLIRFGTEICTSMYCSSPTGLCLILALQLYEHWTATYTPRS